MKLLFSISCAQMAYTMRLSLCRGRKKPQKKLKISAFFETASRCPQRLMERHSLIVDRSYGTPLNGRSISADHTDCHVRILSIH